VQAELPPHTLRHPATRARTKKHLVPAPRI
jgi:hypothetical protein